MSIRGTLSVSEPSRRVAVLFLHGLNLPNHTESLNSRFRQNFLFHLASQSQSKEAEPWTSSPQEIRTVNYASLLEAEQLALLEKVTRQSPMTPLWLRMARVLPLRILNMGLSFWGNPKFKQETMDLICDELNALAERYDDTQQVQLVICGFSMGSTIALEFIHDLFSVTSPVHRKPPALRRLSPKAELFVRGHFSQFVTIGCPITWHFPHRPFSKRPHSGVPWVNFHYRTDVLASRLKNQGSEVSHVEDVEIDIFPKSGFNWQAPMKCMHEMMFVALRATPISHMAYFDDEVLFKGIIDRLMEWKPASRSTTSPDSPQIPESLAIVNRRALQFKLLHENISKTSDSHTILLYVHGMSTEEQIQSEFETFSSATKKVIHELSSHNISFSVFGVSFSSLIEKHRQTRIASYRGRSFSDSAAPLYEPDNTPPSQSAKSKDSEQIPSWTDFIKDIVQSRFPIAMSYWTEPWFRDQIHLAFRKEYGALIQKYRQKLDGKPVESLIVAYTIGSLITANILGEMQQQQDSQFGSVKKFISLGCPLPWFGDASCMALPHWKPEEAPSWINLHYKRDFNAIPLRLAHPKLAECVRQDIELTSHHEFVPYAQPDNSKTNRGLWLKHRVSGLVYSVLPVSEVFGSIDGSYLTESCLWKLVGTFLQTRTTAK